MRISELTGRSTLIVGTVRYVSSTRIGGSGCLRISLLLATAEYALARTIFQPAYLNSYLFGDDYIGDVLSALAAISLLLLVAILFDMQRFRWECPTRSRWQTWGYRLSLVVLGGVWMHLYVVSDRSGVFTFCPFPGCFSPIPWA